MKYKYVDEIVSGYVWYRELKDVKLSDSVKLEFKRYQESIEGYQGAFTDALKQKLTQKAGDIKQQVSDELRSLGMKGEIYVKEYVDFIFKASLLLIGKFGLGQNEAFDVLGLARSAYYKLGIYPSRCYDAYVGMEDKDNRYSLKVDGSDSLGVQIARCINREVQAKYACSQFIGVGNDLDVFANIPLQSGKKFIMTYSKKFLDIARYYFASGNFLSDKEKPLVGQIKDKITCIMKMDIRQVKNGSVENILLDAFLWSISSDKGEKYGCNKDYYIYLSDILEQIKDDGRDVDEVIINSRMNDAENGQNFYNIFANYRTKTGFKWNEENREKVISSLEEYIYNFKSDQIQKMYKYIQRENALDCFNQYKTWLVGTMDKGCDGLDLANEPEDDKVFLAAVFWIKEVFGVASVSEEKYKIVLDYLSTAKISDYVDKLSRTPKKQRYLLFQPIDFDLLGKQKSDDVFKGFGEVNLEEFCRLSNKQVRPTLLYIDAEDYPNVFNLIQDIKGLPNIVFVLHTKNEMSDMKVLSQKLDLYYYTGEMKK